MLGTLLDKLESLFSKRFVVGSIPLLAFLFLHGLMAYRVSYRFQKWVALYFSLDPVHVAVLSFALLLLVVILSYVFSTLSVFLLEILEGKHFGEFLSNALSKRYRDRLKVVEKTLSEARKNLIAIRGNRDDWRATLREAYKQGKYMQACTYQRRAKLNLLFDRCDGNQNITDRELKAEVNAMEATVRANNPELETQESENLDNDYGALLRLINYSVEKWEEQYINYLNKRQFDFAGENVAPTKMGTISNAASYYAASRYSMNLEIFWTRLQKVIQGDSSFYTLLQEAKLQLDFLVELVWLSLTFTLVWIILLPCLGEAENLFLIIAVFGPILTWIWYHIALQNYRAFSDMLRAAIDLYRLDLLKALHIPLPVNAEQERVLWETLEQRFGYGEHPNISLQKT